MRKLTVCMLSWLITTNLLANVKMPVVNIAAGSVSARSAFGEEIVKTTPKTDKKVAQTRKKTVVARTAKKTQPAPVQQTKKPEKLVVANEDFLTPMRPSADLWAKNDTTLRMPHPSEFSVLRNDSVLPEESLDRQVTKPDVMLAKTNTQQTEPVKTKTSEIDTQIARLIDLQKRAEDSVRTVSPRTTVASIAKTENNTTTLAQNTEKQDSVSLRRMVVPMTDDVIVRKVEQSKSPRIARVRNDMTKMSPSELRNAFRKTFLSENKHLSTYSIDSAFDTVSDMSSAVEGFTAKRDLSEGTGIRPLEIKIKFKNDDSALSRENYTLLTEYAGIVVNKPTRAIQVAIPEYRTKSKDERKLAARRLAIVEQVLTDNGVSQQRIVPVLSQRSESGFVLRIISNDQYETITQQQKNIFGDNVGKKTYKSMTW